MDSDKPAVVMLMGPTACGKTDTAISMVESGHYEIISVDSAMIYRDMNIGTAKPCPQTLASAPHYLIDICDPDESYSVAQFCDIANHLIDAIHQRGKIPLLVGGTIMYFNALQFGLSELPAANIEIRERFSLQAQQSGWHSLHQQLENVDPVAAHKIHPNDAQRIQRALEVYELTQKPLSSFHQSNDPVRDDVRFINVGLFPQDRSRLHANIAKRFMHMLECGVVEELTTLREKWSLSPEMPSMRCIGYRQLWKYLENTLTLEQTQDQVIAATRQLAKRQLTWLRHYPKTILIDPYQDQVEGVRAQINRQIKSS
jgi:tRNA dimethylallyltransferase